MSGADEIEKNRLKFNIDWRANKHTYDEQMEQFFMSEELSDIQFVFSDRNGKVTIIPAHKFVVSVGSEFFMKEITLGNANETAVKRSKTVQTIEINDENVEIEAFKKMLFFLYTGFKKLDVTGECVLSLLYIALKYMIKSLKARCIEFLLENSSRENLLPILQCCADWDVDKELLDRCLELLRSNIDEVIKPEFVVSLTKKCLIFVLEDDGLQNVAEVDLFKAALHWAKFACDKKGQDSNNPKNIRSILGDALKLIRFSVMRSREFAESVVPSGVLNTEEQRDVMLMIAGENPVGQLICPTNRRRGTKGYFALTKILSKTALNRNRFSFAIRVDNFRSFVASNASYCTTHMHANDVAWYVVIELEKYCNTTRKYVPVGEFSWDRAKQLGVHVAAVQKSRKKRSFEVDATVSQKTDNENENRNWFWKLFDFFFMPPFYKRFVKKYCFNEENDYRASCGFVDKLYIGDIFELPYDHFLGNSLELQVDLLISEIDD